MENKGKKKLNIWAILSALFAIGAIVCIIILIKTTVDIKKRAEDMSNLVKGSGESIVSSEVISGSESEGSSGTPSDEGSVATEESSRESESSEQLPVDTFAASIQFLKEKGIEIPDLDVDIANLQETVNPDIYAWIYVPGTKVNYPVLQHPSDDSYYLNYNLDGTKGYPGCIYTEKTYNSKDFTDGNTVLYGHNMKNGTMFGSIHRYEDSKFFEENPYIFVYTPERLLCYRIIAAYEHEAEHLLYNHNFDDSDVLLWYFSNVKLQKSINNNFLEEKK